MKPFLFIQSVLTILIFSFSIGYAEDEWVVYDTTNSGLPDNKVLSILEDLDNNMWFGTSNGGVAKFDGMNWINYNTKNSGLPERDVEAIAIDSAGNMWFGTSLGAAYFNGNDWVVFDTYNSSICHNWVRSLAIDTQGNVWMGTFQCISKYFDGEITNLIGSETVGLIYDVRAINIDNENCIWFGAAHGLVRYDGSNWIGIQEGGDINTIANDQKGNIWFGNWWGLYKYDGNDVELFNEDNSNIPENWVKSLAIDKSNNIWIGTVGGGIVKYDGENWKIYNKDNSGLPDNYIQSIYIDHENNVWIGTWYSGVAILKQDPSPVLENTDQPEPTLLAYPNPSDGKATIEFEAKGPSPTTITISDFMGREIARLADNELFKPGTNKLSYNTESLPPGIYFCTMKTGAVMETIKLVVAR